MYIYIYIQYILYYISPVHFLFSVHLPRVFGEEHDLLLSLLRWAIGLEQKSTKDCQTLNWWVYMMQGYIFEVCRLTPNERATPVLWFPHTIESCGLVCTYLYVQNSVDWNCVSFLFFRFSLFGTGQKGSISFILGARAGAASVYNWATETWWPPPIARTVVQLTLDVGEAD